MRSREDTSRAVEARRAGCETVSVTDSLRLPDRLAQRASSQNDLSIVHTGKKSESPERRRLRPFRHGAVRRCLERTCRRKHRRRLERVLLLLRRVLSIHPVSFPARNINCINIGTSCTCLCVNRMPASFFRPSRHEENTPLRSIAITLNRTVQTVRELHANSRTC